jgi:hypothetical protein
MCFVFKATTSQGVAQCNLLGADLALSIYAAVVPPSTSLERTRER